LTAPARPFGTAPVDQSFPVEARRGCRGALLEGSEMSSIQPMSTSGGPMAQGASLNPSVISPEASKSSSPAQRVVSVSSVAQSTANMASQLARPKFDAGEMRKRLEEAVRQLNEQASANNRNLAFNIDDVVNRSIIRVTDKTSGELVRQIPAEEVLHVSHNIEKMKGILFDSKS
jgi:flagellar protein FlaG